MNHSNPSTFRQTAASMDGLGREGASIQLALQQEQRRQQQQNMLDKALRGEVSLGLGNSSLQDLGIAQLINGDPHQSSLMSANDLLTSYLRQGDKMNLQQLLSLQGGGEIGGGGPSLSEDRLRLLLAERASQQEQQSRFSIEDAIRLKRLEELTLQEAVRGGQAGAPSTSLPGWPQQQQQHQQLLSPPGLAYYQAQAKMLLSPAGGLATQLSPMHQSIGAGGDFLSDGKRKAVPQDDFMSVKKRATTSKRRGFPLPQLRGEARKKVTGYKLQSYEKLWDKSNKHQTSTEEVQKELFLRRIHRNEVQFMGKSRSVVLEHSHSRRGKHELKNVMPRSA
jgi:hypothetical protein